ncbi:PE domain-containing protein [Mycobacterium gordonae]|jgi:triacylglycerol lipase|uniref:Lipase n=1 Tax=Mycobacterium gordonae TaxID=1778 RepID=A0A1A6B7Z1_MYCGO|nr:PE domain-containing protein [Mycobacterium gordonae]MBI2698727.1 PE domain-containing protein [Mycobacterium sp.]MCQ4364541.1 PE domain-containing protein [Mycobacterium gordonae]MCV7010556.1 PE domain-containing protein [Mycobacterium gordonae]OBR98454.1 lipase [Mycobacterium gordonae]ODR22894.1 lipase [Mycobacterium gordonae]
MSLMVVPEWVTAAAADAADVASSIGAANAAASAPTTGLLAAAEDEVSAAIAALFSAHGEGYQVLSAQVARFHSEFVHTLTTASSAYAAAEAASAAPLQTFEGAVTLLQQEIAQFPAGVAAGVNRIANEVFTTVFGAPAGPPIPAGDLGTFTGSPSLVTRFEEALLYPVKPLLNLSGLDTYIATPGNPILQLLASDVPPLSWFIGNSPPPLLNLLLGETVSYSTFDNPTGGTMSVVHITPANATGEQVVAIHGGAFIFPPSFLHWIHYSVMAYQTGATIQVPIYPLLQEGGTAGLVVPMMANFISAQTTQYGTPYVSVIGDSAGGNLALASVQQMMLNGAQLPSSMVLLSPWLDLSMTNPNIAFVQDPLLPVGLAQQFGRQWAGGLPIGNYQVSPINGPLAGLPPTTVYTGNLDILSPDALVLKARAALDNAPFSFVLANGQIHDWLILTLDGPVYWHQINQELGIAA